MSEIDAAGQDDEHPDGSDNGEPASDGVQEGAHSAGGDSLNEIDEIVDHWSQLRQESADEQAHAEIEREHFLQEFRAITSSVIRPTMDTALERLRKDGGGGLIEEGGPESRRKPRVTLWMSMKGEIAGSPRQDLNPFLQLDADPVQRQIDVWEGDMVENQGTSRATSPWALSEVTEEAVMGRIVAILRRAGTHGVGQ